MSEIGLRDRNTVLPATTLTTITKKKKSPGPWTDETKVELSEHNSKRYDQHQQKQGSLSPKEHHI